MSERRPLGGILIGGSSRRMGRPKAEILFHGKRLDTIAADALRPHCEALHRLGEHGIPDPPGRQGPIAGIAAARAHTPEAWWVIVACDMPLLTSEAISWLLDARQPGACAVIPRLETGGPQPTLALYGPGVDPLLETLTAPIQLIGQPGVQTPRVPEHLARCWTNVNRPDELAALSPV